ARTRSPARSLRSYPNVRPAIARQEVQGRGARRAEGYGARAAAPSPEPSAEAQAVEDQMRRTFMPAVVDDGGAFARARGEREKAFVRARGLGRAHLVTEHDGAGRHRVDDRASALETGLARAGNTRGAPPPEHPFGVTGWIAWQRRVHVSVENFTLCTAPKRLRSALTR